MNQCWLLLLLPSLMMISVDGTPPNLHTRSHDVHGRGQERIDDAFQSHLQHPSSPDDDHVLDHEAILGSRHKAQEYDGLSVDESKRRLKILAEKGMDANKDGFVDQDELQAWVLQSFKNLAIEEGRDQLADEDANEDGFVTWNEHLKAAFDLDDGLRATSNIENELLQEDKQLWQAADLNHDDRLDAKEFAMFVNPEDFEQMHKTLVQQMLDRRDRNYDGFVDFQEFISDEHGNIPDAKTEHYISEKDKFDNDYDLNHDSKLDFQECVHWIIPDNREIAKNEAIHLIQSADTNHDGKLSIEEIIDNHDVFVGSEATDFGDQLHYHKHLEDEL